MKKLFFLLIAFAVSPMLFAEECETVYGIASVTYERQAPQPGNGRFAVSDSKVVRFSTGNLCYNPSAEGNKFYFSAQQYTKIHAATGYSNDPANETIDLFGYGSSGEGAYLPTLKMEDNNAYPDGNINDTQYDWGVHNAIGTESEAGLWRTLTFAEWNYLFTQRPNFANLRSAAKVNGVKGLLLLPDDWNTPEGCPTFYPLESFNSIGDSKNNYTTEQWTIFENAGAIFLPAVGSCDGYDNEYCCYWTSTQVNASDGNRFDFGNEDQNPRLSSVGKRIRSSVRLVQDW